MAKPKLNQIKPFDANIHQTITFSWNGNQAFGNRLLVFDKETMSSIYDTTVKSFSYSHIIPSGTLENGKSYVCQCQIFDSEWIESTLSDKIYFSTFKTPEFKFNDIPGGIIRASSYDAGVTYYQEDFEPLQYYKFTLYDSSRSMLLESDILYNTNTISYSFKGLKNDERYFLRCQGITCNGMETDTGFWEVYVFYEAPGVYSRLYAECDHDNGCVKYHTNINIITPSESGGPKVERKSLSTKEFLTIEQAQLYESARADMEYPYEFDDGKINLIERSIEYDDGFLIADDFTLKINGTHLFRDGDILTLKNKKSDSIRITALLPQEGQIRYKLIVPNGVSSYILYSPPLSGSPHDKITILLRRVQNLYTIKAYSGGDE